MSGQVEERQSIASRWQTRLVNGVLVAPLTAIFEEDDIAIVHGLQKAPTLNGQRCLLLEWHSDVERWAVQIATSKKRVMIRPRNLQHLEMRNSTMGDSDTYSYDSSPGSVDTNEHNRASCTKTLRKLETKGTASDVPWFVYTKQAKFWGGTPPRRVGLVAIACLHHVHIFFTDSEDIVPSPDVILGAVDQVMCSNNKRPSQLVICPLSNVMFRPRQALALARSVGKQVFPDCDVVPAAVCELPDSFEGSINQRSYPPPSHDQQQEPWEMYADIVEEKFEEMEERLQSSIGQGPQLGARLGGFFQTSKDPEAPGYGTNSDASVLALREIFEAAKVFHDLKPWETLSNDEYVCIRDESTGREAFAMVLGHTDYDGRGLKVYYTFKDFKRQLKSLNSKATSGVDQLQYLTPGSAPFSSLDAISTLSLPLAEEPSGESIPLLFRSDGAKCPPSLDGIVNKWSKVPPHQDWVFLSKVMRAVAEFASNTIRVGAVLMPGFVTIQGMGVYGAQHGSGRKMNMVEYQLANMSIGSQEKCNFCLKPVAAMSADGQACMRSLCNDCGIRYCSDNCRWRDGHRHKYMCS